MTWDWFVCGLLLLGVATGMWTMQVHHGYFSKFRVRDLLRGRRDGLLYLWNTGSTAWCLVDCIARAAWLAEVGWGDAVSAKWRVIWLSLHAFGACLAIVGHIAVHVSLKHVELCDRCGSADIISAKTLRKGA